MDDLNHDDQKEEMRSEQVSAAETSGKNADRMLPISILIAAVMISGSVLFATLYKAPAAPAAPDQGTANAPAAPTAAQLAQVLQLGSTDVALGNANAPITLVEYGDYQCPFCAMFFNQTQPQLIKDYVDTGKVKLIFRNLIVNDRSASDHESHNAALAAECAKDQGKFWPYHDALYTAESKDGTENNGNLTRALFIQLAGNVGMDKTQFTSCYDAGKYTTTVQTQSDAAEAVGINATPTFFANGQEILGAQPYSAFQQLFSSLLKG